MYRFVTLAVLLCISGAGAAETQKVVDKRNRSEVSTTEVHFCYRPSPKFFDIPGHAYVAFYKQERPGKPVTFRAFGATAKNVIGIFGGDGYLQPEYTSNIRQDCLIAQVNSDVYARAWGVASPLFTEPEYSYWNYNITSDTCVDYARRVAMEVGLRVNRNAVPSQFIETLKSDN